MVGFIPLPIRTGLIGGLGYAGTVFHTPLLQSLPDLFLLVHVVDILRPSGGNSGSVNNQTGWFPPSFCETYGPNVKFSSSYSNVLEDPDIELVIIATPNNTHFDYAKAALEAGKHVLLDKPVTTSYAQARQLGEIAGQQNLVLYAFQNRRWDSDYLTLQSLLRQGILGPVVDFVSHYDRYRDYLKGTWKEKAGPGSGQFFSLGPHLIDQTLHCFGRPERVTAFIENIRGMGDEAVDDDFTVILHYSRSASNPYVMRATLRGHLLSMRKEQLRFIVRGSKGCFSKHGMDVQEEQMKHGGVEAVTAPDFGREPKEIWGTLETTKGSEVITSRVESERGRYQDLYRNLASVIREGEEPDVKWKEAELTMLITELAIQSSKEGRTIYVPPEDESAPASSTPSPSQISLEDSTVSHDLTQHGSVWNRTWSRFGELLRRY